MTTIHATNELATVHPLLVPQVHRVVEVIDEVPDVVTLRVVPVHGEPFEFLPAQCSMVGAFGIGEAAISISSGVHQADFHEYTIRRAGAITSALTSLSPGDELWVRGPFGTPWNLDVDGADVVVAAGGLGIAPMRAAILELARHRDRYGTVVVVAGARSATLLPFRNQFASWRAQGLTVVATIDRPEDNWKGRVGFVSDVVADVVGEQRLDTGNLHALVCGPDIMMRLTAERLVDAGVDPEAVQITVERNMQCGNALCGHCQAGGVIVCRDGPVLSYPAVAQALAVPEY